MRRQSVLRLLFPLLALTAALGLSSASAVSDSYGSVAFHPFTIDPLGGCVASTEPSGTQVGNCDPVNLIFPGRTWYQVQELLLMHGWTLVGLGSFQKLHFTDGGVFALQQTQLFRSEGPASRYHIRLWQAPGANPPVTLGAVHHEAGILNHTIDLDWDAAEAYVAGQLCSTPCGQTSPLTQQLAMQATDPDGDPARWRQWLNDGKATVIDTSSTTSLCPFWLWWCRR